MNIEGFRTIKATELQDLQRERLRRTLQAELTEAMIKAVKENPPMIDLSEIDLILKPGQIIDDWDVTADCGTCGTCGTHGGCGTCGTS